MALTLNGKVDLTAPTPRLSRTAAATFLTTLYVTNPKHIPSSVSSSSSSSVTDSDYTSGPLNWAPHSWKSKKALQLPDYPDPDELGTVLQTLESFPPIVFAGEARKLEDRLAQAAMGDAFLLQGGDCAESFKEFNGTNIRDTFRVLLQMGIVLTYGAQIPVIKVLCLSLWYKYWFFASFRELSFPFYDLAVALRYWEIRHLLAGFVVYWGLLDASPISEFSFWIFRLYFSFKPSTLAGCLVLIRCYLFL